MITDKKISIKPILESHSGIHLTAYLVYSEDLVNLKSQLRECLAEAYEHLQPVMSIEERKKFLEPLDSLLSDARIFKNMQSNIGLFRTKDSFRILSVPVELERQCQIATTFHVKPLLKWMQTDQDFLFIGLDKKSINVYFGNQTSFQKIECVPLSLGKKNRYQSDKNSELKHKTKKAFDYINDWLNERILRSKPPLFSAGSPKLLSQFLARLTYPNKVRTAVSNEFSETALNEIVCDIREVLNYKSKSGLERSIAEFKLAEEINLTQKNIFQISRAAVKGKVKKLIIADEYKIFGKIDSKTGDLEINAFDLDHEDDDILDDLAQTVLSQGGEVVVASKEDIPKNRPVLAILESDQNEIEKAQEERQVNILQERVG